MITGPSNISCNRANIYTGPRSRLGIVSMMPVGFHRKDVRRYGWVRAVDFEGLTIPNRDRVESFGVV